MKRSVVMISLLFVVIFFTGCGDKKNETMEKDTKAESTNQNEESIVRTGIIDVASIDKNKDEKVYQCPMDWNVIDDKHGTCPECKMDLEEYTIAQARDNLIKNDYEVK